MKNQIKECLDWMINNKYDDIQIIYDDGDYLSDDDMEIIKSGNYELVERVQDWMGKKENSIDEELCFRIIFKPTNPTMSEDAEIYCFSDIWNKEWIRWHRDLILEKLLNNLAD